MPAARLVALVLVPQYHYHKGPIVAWLSKGACQSCLESYLLRGQCLNPHRKFCLVIISKSKIHNIVEYSPSATELRAPIFSKQVFGLKFSFEKIKFTFSFEIN